MAVLLQRGSDNDRIGMLQHSRGVFRGYPGTDNNRQLGRATRGRKIGRRCFASGRLARDDDRIRPEKLRGLDRFGEADVRGHGVRRVLLFHVGPHGNVLRADQLPVAQQRTRAGIQPSLIGHVAEYKTLRTDEVHPRRQGNSQRALVGSG